MPSCPGGHSSHSSYNFPFPRSRECLSVLEGAHSTHPITSRSPGPANALLSWRALIPLILLLPVSPGPVNAFLSWRALIPLSRLTYMAYLIHPIVMVWYNSTREVRIVFSHSEMVSNHIIIEKCCLKSYILR